MDVDGFSEKMKDIGHFMVNPIFFIFIFFENRTAFLFFGFFILLVV